MNIMKNIRNENGTNYVDMNHQKPHLRSKFESVNND